MKPLKSASFGARLSLPRGDAAHGSRRRHEPLADRAPGDTVPARDPARQPLPCEHEVAAGDQGPVIDGEVRDPTALAAPSDGVPSPAVPCGERERTPAAGELEISPGDDLIPEDLQRQTGPSVPPPSGRQLVPSHSAMFAAATSPMRVNPPPAYTRPWRSASVRMLPSTGPPNADHW